MSNYQELYEKWLNSSALTEEEKLQLKNVADDEVEKEDRFYKELEFGTAGLRGKVGMGSNRMNRFIIARATKALAQTIIDNGLQEKGIAIAHDPRLFSKEFAKLAALVMASNGVKAYLFEDLRPTPELSFAVRYLGTASGINITASHNPKEYNGYKVYWQEGSQIKSDISDKVLEYINSMDIFDNYVTLTEEEAKQNALDKARLKAFDREIRINKDKQILAKELGDKELQAKLKLKEKTFKTGRKSLIEKNPTVIGKPPKKVVEDESKKTNINNKTTMKSIEDKPKKVYNKDRIVFKTLTENDLPRILEESGKIAYDDRNPIYYRITGGYVATKSSFKINSALRQGIGDSLNDYDKLTISTLDKVIKSNSLKENIILTRYSKMNILDAIIDQNPILKGVTSEKEMLRLINKNTAVLNDKGFVSTSVVPELNYFKDYPIRLKIHAEKGQKVYMTDNFEESEMILPRNSNFVITKAAIVDEKIEFTINIVKENDHEI